MLKVGVDLMHSILVVGIKNKTFSNARVGGGIRNTPHLLVVHISLHFIHVLVSFEL